MDALRVELTGGLAVVTPEHPPLNLFDHEVFDALEDVRSVLEDGPGKAVFRGR